MLAIIWPEIVKKCYNKLCDNIYRSSLPYKTDSVTIIFQHMLKQCSLYFLNKKLLNFDISSIFWYKIFSCLCLLTYNLVTTNHAVKSQHTIMHLPFVNLGAKLQPNKVDAHCFETLRLQHTLVWLNYISNKPRRSRLLTLPRLRITDETR